MPSCFAYTPCCLAPGSSQPIPWKLTTEVLAAVLTHSLCGTGTLLVVQFFLFGWVEGKRWMDYRKPGSQAEPGSFLGLEGAFKSQSNGYPGGIFFDPLGFSRYLDLFSGNHCVVFRSSMLLGGNWENWVIMYLWHFTVGSFVFDFSPLQTSKPCILSLDDP